MKPEEPMHVPDAQPQDEQMTPSEEEESEEESEPTPPPSPVKKKKGKKQLHKKKRKTVTSDEEESNEEDPVDVHARMRDYNNLAKAAYDSQMARAKTDLIYRSMFPYIG